MRDELPSTTSPSIRLVGGDNQNASLRQTVRALCWQDAQTAAAALQLARDTRLPIGAVQGIISSTEASLRMLAPDGNAKPIVRRAIEGMAKAAAERQDSARDDAIIEAYLRRLPDRDYEMVRLSKLGKKHSQIAALTATNTDEVRATLVRIYADLRIRIWSGPDGGGGEPAPCPIALGPGAEAPTSAGMLAESLVA